MGSTYREKLEKYSDLSEKKAVRDFIMSHFTDCTSIIGLAGPKINEYINWCETNKFDNIQIFENDMDTLMSQIYSIRAPVKLSYGDITSINPNVENTFIDLDFCSTIAKFATEIPKFKDSKYCMTYSRRSVGTEGTISKFFEIMGEKVTRIFHINNPIKYRHYHTSSGREYVFSPYWDSSPMCCISKIN